MKTIRYLFALLLLLITSVSQEQTPDTISKDTLQAYEWLDEGLEFAKEQKYPEAISMLSKSLDVLEKVPNRRKGEAEHAIYQSYGYSGDWESALKYAKQNYETGKAAQPPIPPIALNNIVYDIGYIFDFLHEPDSAIAYYLKSIEEFEKIKPTQNQDLGLIHHNLSNCYKGYNYLEEALFHAKKSYDYWTKSESETSDYLKAMYTNFAGIYAALNSIDLAKEYNEKSLAISKKIIASGKEASLYQYANIANLLSKNGNYSDAIIFAQKSITDLERLGKKTDQNTLATIYNNLGLYLLQLKKYEESETALLKAIELYPSKISAYLNLWTLYQEPPFQKYAQILEQIKEIGPMAAKQGASNLPPIYIVRAKTLARQEQFDDAFLNFQYALNVALGKDKNEPFDKTTMFSIDSIPNNGFIQKIFRARTFLFKTAFKASNEIDDLKTAFEHSLFSVELFEAYYRQIPYIQRTKTKETKNVYEEAIELGFELFKKTGDAAYLERAFQLSEQFKGNKILSGLNETKAKATSNLPKKLLEKEKETRIKLTYYKSNLFEAKKNKDTKSIGKMQEKYTYWQREYEDLMNNLEKRYPKYFDLKYQKAQIKIADLQKKVLQPNQALIEYFVGNEAIYTWSIQKGNLNFYKKEKPETLRPLIEDLRENITDYTARAKNPQVAFNSYTKNATELFDILLKKVVADQQINRLLIVPDEALNFLSFETLLTESADTNTVNYKSLPYLIKDYSVAYSYASKLLLQKHEHQPKYYLAAFAPAYEQFAENDTTNSNTLAMLVRDGEVQLPGAQKEVKTITETYEGTAFLGKKANENNFKEKASKYQILHLSMHAIMDMEYPMRSHLVFENDASQEDNLLQIGELYNMNIPADMVVLSACNSGLGRIQTGDGVQSLATAFNYAGAKSTIMSLWKVPDQSTAPVMIDFYHQLHNENKATKDNALRQAKLNYLDETVADELAHPIYWAGFIASGDMSPLEKHGNNGIWWMIGLVSIATLLFWYLKRSPENSI